MYTQEEKWLLKEKYQGKEPKSFVDDCKRLAEGEPLAYVIGSIPFLDCTIYLDSHPLIPRPETEFWVEKAIKTIRESDTQEHPRILDLCAGSGCIGIAVAKAIPKVEVTIAEIDPSHYQTINRTITENGLAENRCQVCITDLFGSLDPAEKYDFILSNPPYIDPVVNRAESSVTDYEPHIALYGGTEGLEIIERILSEAPKYLKPNGQLWIEHEPEQETRIAEIAHKNNFTSVAYRDQYEVVRYTQLLIQ
jgi:release factor glutamine methyltransferase